MMVITAYIILFASIAIWAATYVWVRRVTHRIDIDGERKYWYMAGRYDEAAAINTAPNDLTLRRSIAYRQCSARFDEDWATVILTTKTTPPTST